MYPLKRGASLLDNAELRLSLRGLYNLEMPLQTLWIFGDRPAWLHGARHVPMEDRGDKALNLTAKYRAMVDEPELSDPFLLLDDDHIFLKPTREIALHTMGALWTLARQYRGKTHGRYLQAALEALTQRGLPSRNYQIHYPLLIDKGALRASLELMKRPMVMGSIYGNILQGPTTEVVADFRINTESDYRRLQDSHFVSFAPVVQAHYLSWVQKQLPRPSSWESAPSEPAAAAATVTA